MKRAVLLSPLLAVGILSVTLFGLQNPPAGQGRGGAGAPAVPLPPLARIKVRDNLYMITNGGGNTAVFITSNGVVLVDTKNPNNGPGIMEHVRAVTNKPVTMVIKTVEQAATEYKIPEKYTGYTSGRGAANNIRIAYTELGGK
jgi:hypothetical protein